jgi:VWFA-related protein
MRCAPVALSVVLLTAAASAQSDDPPATTQPFRTGTEGVVVDVVVRDGRGRPVTDLQASDFELFEDGVAQEIADVLLANAPAGADGQKAGKQQTPAARPADAASPAAVTDVTDPLLPRPIALVFDRLSPEARALAHKAALSYLDTRGPLDPTGVFLIDLSLRTLLPYSTDRGEIRAAIDQAVTAVTSRFDRRSETSNNCVACGLYDSDTASAEHMGPPVLQGGDLAAQSITERSLLATISDPGEFKRQQMLLSMERSFQALARDQQGYATTQALLAIVSSMRLLPGRKSIVFFAEGLQLPTAVLKDFDAVVKTANSANVAIYAVDAAGLRVHSDQIRAMKELRAMGVSGISDEEAGYAGGKAGESRDDRMIGILREDPAAALGSLSQHTGGFLINNTNDLAEGFRRIDEDRRFHYLLTYAPRNQDFDGRFRNITVRVKRRGVQVRARNGYLAVKRTSTAPVLAFEAPALALLDTPPLPRELPIRSAALAFPDVKRPGLMAVTVGVPASGLTFEPAEDNHVQAEFTIVARIRDTAGAIVRKGSQPYALSIPADRLAATRAADVLFYREPQLPPGDYTLEAIVYDARAKKAGARVVRFDVPEPAGKAMQLGSLVLVRRSEPWDPKEERTDHPLRYENLLLVPNLGEALSRAHDKAVSFYAAALLPEEAPLPDAEMEVARRGEAAAAARLPLERAFPDAAGRVQFVGQLPLDALSPGEYELRLMVSCGDQRETRTARLKVIP